MNSKVFVVGTPVGEKTEAVIQKCFQIAGYQNDQAKHVCLFILLFVTANIYRKLPSSFKGESGK